MLKGKTARASRRLLQMLLACALVAAPSFAQQRDVSREQARAVRPWVRDAVVYEIYPRAFSAEGNFNGITKQLDRLRELGVTVLWLMPIHPIGQEKRKGSVGSPYAVRDYYAINPDYGTKEDLKRLVAEAHRRQMKVIIDVVANHTSWDSVLMKNPDYYVRDPRTGKINSPYDWTDVAELNYDNAALRRYMIDMLKFWLTEFDLDGFRCDVAAEVPTDFWEQARAECDRVKADAVWLAESDKPELLVKAFDFDYAWPMHSTLTDVLQGRREASAIRQTWESDARKYPRASLRLRFSDNHDERRAIARFGEPAALAASALMFTLDGLPLLYNGMEAGDTTESGAPALFERMPVFWQFAERRADFPRFYKQFIALRKSHPALRRGETEWLKNSDDARVLTFARRDGEEEIVVVINFSSHPTVASVEARAGQYTDITPDIHAPLPADAPAHERASRQRASSLPVVALDAWGWRIYKRQK